jgi:hypothetical protein
VFVCEKDRGEGGGGGRGGKGRQREKARKNSHTTGITGIYRRDILGTLLKKLFDIPVHCRNVTYQTFPGRNNSTLLKSSRIYFLILIQAGTRQY